MATKRKGKSFSTKTPRPESLSKQKRYTVANACPECGNDNGDKMVRLRAGFIQCEKCGTSFDTGDLV